MPSWEKGLLSLSSIQLHSQTNGISVLNGSVRDSDFVLDPFKNASEKEMMPLQLSLVLGWFGCLASTLIWAPVDPSLPSSVYDLANDSSNPLNRATGPGGANWSVWPEVSGWEPDVAHHLSSQWAEGTVQCWVHEHTSLTCWVIAELSTWQRQLHFQWGKT